MRIATLRDDHLATGALTLAKGLDREEIGEVVLLVAIEHTRAAAVLLANIVWVATIEC